MSEIKTLYWGALKIEGQQVVPSSRPGMNQWSIRLSKDNVYKYFDYWTGTAISELDLKNAFSCIARDASCAFNFDFEEYCSEFEENPDSLSALDTYNKCASTLHKLQELDPDFDVSIVDQLSDYGIVVGDRIYAEIAEVAHGDNVMILFDDVPYEAYWSYEDRAHPGSDSYHTLGPGWMDVVERMPFHNDDILYWTPIFTQEPVTSSYNIAPCDVQLIKPSSDDDDYYLTI